ncbi:histidine phosphatase family protein [uncultured Methylobacterium sp.]|uniref:SixA phosphatase family protein n=1 Tax=uncultured Methylobacterium sp. TaxID=157278 RepID=UPI0035CB8A2D
MRRLLLLRHAKSDRPAGVPDLDRPLNPRGRTAAPRMGAYLADEGLRPDFALVSPSLRTRETWEAVRAALGEIPSRIERTIYEAPAAALRDTIRAAPEAARTLLLIGHNPGIQDLAHALAARGSHAARDRLATQFPTAALAVIAFEVETWDAVGRGGGRLERFVRPKDLAAELAD